MDLKLKISEHIILLTPGFAVDEFDSICVPPLQMLALELVKIVGYENVTIVAMHYPYKPCKYKWNGINVIGIGANNAKFPMRLKHWKSLRKTLDTLLETKGKILIHSFWFSELAYIAEKWANKNRMQHSVTLMGQEVKKGNKYISRTPISENRIISLSQFQSSVIQKNYNITPGSTLCFGIDDTIIKESVIKYDVIGVGSTVEVKNYDKFLEVIQVVKKSIPEIKVCIVGGGDLLEKITMKSIEMGLKDNIEFTDLITRNQSILKMSESNLLLHTSNFESLGFVYLEAMQQGLSIVSTPVGIAPEITKIETGETIDELARSVVENLQNPIDVEYEKTPSVKDVTIEYIEFWKKNKI